MDPYEEISNQLRKRAADFLEKYRIVNILDKYGKTQIYGSYELDLMYRNDIDIALMVDDFDYDVVLKIQEELVALGFNHFGYLIIGKVDLRKTQNV